MTVTKIAEIKNTGASDAWVRVKVERASSSRARAHRTPASWNWRSIPPTGRKKDGYYYYTKALKPGEVTAPVFTSVTFNATMGNEYQNATATVNVSAQAVQTANNGATVMDAKVGPIRKEAALEEQKRDSH